MGFLGFGKNKNEKPDAKGKKANSKSAKPADFKKQYPFLASVKIPEVVPAKTLATLQEKVAGDDTKVGALREAEDKSGYLVAMISEEQLVSVGFNTKNSAVAAGQFAQGFKKRIITSATLRNDLNQGFITFVPDSASLNYLGRIEECTNLKYQLALFPAAIDDEDSLACEPLKYLGNGNEDGLVSYGDLTEIADKAKQLVIKREDGTVADEEYYQSVQAEEVDDDPAGELSTSGKLSDYDPDADVDVDVEDEDETSTQDADFFDIDADAPVDTSDVEEPSDDDDDVDVEEDDEDYDFDDDISDEDLDGFTEEDDALQEKLNALSASNPVDEDEEEAKYDATDAKTFATTLQDLANTDIDLSSDLGLNASTSDISSYYNADKLPQLDIVDAGDDELQKRLNVLRSSFNNNLAQYLVDKRKARITEYTSRLNELSAKVAEDVSIERNDAFKQELENLKTDYKNSEDAIGKEIKARQADLRGDYDTAKKEYIDAAAKQAAVEYEAKNKADLVERVHEVEKTLSDKPLIAYNQGLLALNDRRKSEAQTKFNSAKIDILGEIRNGFAEDDAEVQSLYENFKAEIDTKLNDNYANEVTRAENLKAVADHDDTIERLNAQIEDLNAAHEEELSNVRQELDDDYRKKLDNKADEIDHLNSTIDTIEKNNKSNVSRLQSEHDSRISTYEKTINNLQDQYHEKVEESKLDYEKNSTTRRNYAIVAIAATVLVGLLAFFIGNAVGGNKSQTTTASNGAPTYIVPSTQQQTAPSIQSASPATTTTQSSASTASDASSSSEAAKSSDASSTTKSTTDTHKSDNKTQSNDSVDNH